MSDQSHLPTTQELDTFEETAYTEAKERFEQLLSEHNDKTFYGFYLFTTDDVRYISIGAFIKDLDDNTDTKWSPCDATLHSQYDFLERAESTIWWFLGDNEDIELDDDEFERVAVLHKDRLLKVMQRLDNSGIFLNNQERDSYVLHVLMGDQDDEERIAYASQLNPPHVAEHYEKELGEIYS